MNKLKELRGRFKEIAAQADAIISAADKDNDGVLSADQQEQFDALMAESDKVKAQIDNLERLGNLRGDLEESPGRQTAAERPKTPESIVTKEEQQLCGFQDMADFGNAVKLASRKSNAIVDDRLKAMPEILGAPTNFHRESGSEEGFMVPPAMRSEIWEMVFNGSSILDQVDNEPTNSNHVQVTTDESTPWGTTGVQAYWADEADQMTASKLATKEAQMKLHKLYAFVLATDELIEDAPRLGRRLTKGASDAIRFKAADAIFSGNGVGKPLGFLNSGALVTVSKEGGQSADTVLAANVAKLFARQINPGRANWYVNQDVLPQLMTMTLGDQPIWTPPSSGFQNAPGGFLLGRPVQFTEHNPTLGDVGDISFVDPLGYYAATKQAGLKFASSLHLYFDYDMEAFRWTFRLGGQPFLSAPVAPHKGNATKSHFTVLEAR